MSIDNDQQLKVAEDFLRFVKRHNAVLRDKRIKQSLQEAIDLIDEKNDEIRDLKRQIDDLEHEISAFKDLLVIAGAINEQKVRD